MNCEIKGSRDGEDDAGRILKVEQKLHMSVFSCSDAFKHRCGIFYEKCDCMMANGRIKSVVVRLEAVCSERRSYIENTIRCKNILEFSIWTDKLD